MRKRGVPGSAAAVEEGVGPSGDPRACTWHRFHHTCSLSVTL